jgi:hypothetical protein
MGGLWLPEFVNWIESKAAHLPCHRKRKPGGNFGCPRAPHPQLTETQMTLPNLSPKAIAAYNRFAQELAAFNAMLIKSKKPEPVQDETLLAINGMIIIANRLFRRHADLPRFFPVSVNQPMAHADLAVLIGRLTAASLHFEERYHHLTTAGPKATRPEIAPLRSCRPA